MKSFRQADSRVRGNDTQHERGQVMSSKTKLYRVQDIYRSPKTTNLPSTLLKDTTSKGEIRKFYKQISQLKETAGRLSFMISEIQFVLEHSPKLRRQA